MLDEGQLERVRDEFTSLLRGIEREGSDIDGLLAWMDSHGFFTSPATTQYHCSFDGGLALHSLNVYKSLCNLAGEYACNRETVLPARLDDNGNVLPPLVKETPRYGKDTLLIVGLLHGLGKAGLYEKYSRNEKDYSKYGKSKDALGYYSWKSTLGYKVVDEAKRDIYGDSGFSSYFIASGFIPLTTEESVVLANFNELLSDDKNKASMYQILAKYPLASLLLSASVLSAYCTERPDA